MRASRGQSQLVLWVCLSVSWHVDYADDTWCEFDKFIIIIILIAADMICWHHEMPWSLTSKLSLHESLSIWLDNCCKQSQLRSQSSRSIPARRKASLRSRNSPLLRRKPHCSELADGNLPELADIDMAWGSRSLLFRTVWIWRLTS